jgi:glyceraldehyde 3-phosphate dehydrogenase
VNIAINGFGRIGRNFFRAYLEDTQAQKEITISVINIGNADKTLIAHLFQYDTLMGTFPGNVHADDQFLYVNDHKIKLIAEMDAAKLPWGENNIEWVLDCSGAYTKREKALLHLQSGADFVLISAPAQKEDISIIPGVNMDQFNAEKHKIVSLGSCTTNALLPVLQVLHQNFEIQSAYMNTVHAYTNSQVLLDVEKKDPRRSRAAALNIIPTTSGAVKMAGKIIPDLDTKVNGLALRVPVGKVSFLDLSFSAKKEISVEKIHAAFGESMRNTMCGIIDITEKPLVSSDFFGNNHSVIIDSLLTSVTGNIGKIFGWYDNEWGYSVRLKDFLLHVTKTI